MEIDLTLISSASVFIPTLVGLITFRKLGTTYRWVFYLIIIGFICEASEGFLLHTEFNKFVVNAYGIMEVIVLSMIYVQLSQEKWWKRSILITMSLLCIFFIINLVFIQGFKNLNSVSLILECVYFIVLSSRFFILFSQQLPDRPLLKHEAFWLNMAVFGYFALNFFIFMLIESLYKNSGHDSHGIHLRNIHCIVNIFFNLALSLSLWFASHNKTDSTTIEHAESVP